MWLAHRVSVSVRSVEMRLTSWFDYVVEGHAAGYLAPVTGMMAGVVPVGSALSVEARLFHLSNMSSAPPNLGLEAVTVLVGYRRPLAR
jgi:hypothetical protein